ncbi:MAG: hypothetical protein L0Z53_06180 [Acidobacteriales bacterium]|nr:hypothetical protein [Terriglobales bacterium]
MSTPTLSPSSLPLAEAVAVAERLASEKENERGAPLTADPYDLKIEANRRAISKRISKRMTVDKNARQAFEREWFRNVLYFSGQQWVIYDRGRWRPKNLPKWFPQTITNKFAEKTNDLVSTLMQTRTPITYLPATDDKDDLATAEVGSRLREVLYEEAGIDEVESMLAAWVILTGNGFLQTYYDTSDEYGTTTVQKKQCALCQAVSSPLEIQQSGGVCPACLQAAEQTGGEPPTVSQFNDAFDQSGMPISEEFPIGCLKADVISPFEIHVDHTIPYFSRHRWYIRVRPYDLEFARDKWGAQLGGRDKIADISPQAGLGMFYLTALAHVTSSFTGSQSASGGRFGASVAENPRTLAYEFYELPSEEYPQGLRAVRIGASDETVVEAGPLPFEIGAGPRKGRKFLNLTHFGGEILPGRFWRKARLNDLITLQNLRNTVESNLKLSVQRMANEVWLNPVGSGVSAITGEPAQIIEYTPFSPAGGGTFAKPERLPANLTNMQPLIIFLNKIDDSMERVIGTFFLQGGDAPPGVTAASALAYLGERAQKAMSPLLREWAKGWKAWEAIAIETFRAHAHDERIRVIMGRNGRYKTEKFRSADLTGAVNLKIDYEGLFPKSQATTRATIAQLTQLGYINPLDPGLAQRVLEAFGETSLSGTSADLDWEEAAREWQEFHEKGVVPQVIPLVQNSSVHLQQHADDAKTDEFRELPPERREAWLQHVQATVMDIMARQSVFPQPATDRTGKAPDGSNGAEPPTSQGDNIQSELANRAEERAMDIAAPREAQPPTG